MIVEVSISVVIATHNRANYLMQALEGLAHQTLPHEEFEVLVVDNNSTDETKQVVTLFAKTNSFVKYLYELRIGSNIARNTGLRQAMGKYVAFLDDDAVPSPFWLENIIKAFNSQTLLGIVGGKVDPVWEKERPKWIQGKLLKALSILDYGNSPRFLKENEFFFSVNMAFKRELLEQFGGFETGVSRAGKNLLTNDEIPITIKIRKAGFRLYYDPSILVNHIIPEIRLTHQWFIKRYFSQGYSDALMWRIMEKPTFFMRCKKGVFHLYCFLRNPRYILRLFYLPSNHDDLYKKLIAHAWLGYLKGLFA